MKNVNSLVSLILLAATCICCQKTSFPETLYITSSTGAFNGEKAEELLPSEASLTIDWASSGKASLSIKYSWTVDGGFTIDISDVELNGSADNFSIPEQDVAARCKLSFAREDYKDITLKVSGHYNSRATNNKFFLLIDPSDNTICPSLEINNASTTKVNLMRGGAEDPGALPRLVLVNQLNLPITFEWNHLGISSTVIKANETKSFLLEDIEYLEDPYLKPSIGKSSITIDGQKYMVDLFADWEYTEEYCRKYTFTDGAPEDVSYKKYTFTITPEIYDNLIKETAS